MITILKPALQTTVQDLGRHGCRHLGVATCGAIDRLSLKIANTLVGNGEDAAGLELCVPPARIRFDTGCAIALTGADCAARLDGVPLGIGRCVSVEAGQTLDLASPTSGVYAYLCVSGGIDAPVVMGSRSTDLQARIGGLEGRLIRRGDVLRVLPSPVSHRTSAGVLLPQLDRAIRVTAGPEFDRLSPDSRAAFFHVSWKIAVQSNKMGYRLEGPTLVWQDTAELRSHAVFPGVIQVPVGGAPIVLMADAQVTGGYPRFAAVVAADHWRLAQVPAGAFLRFELLTRTDALLAWQKQLRYLQRLREGLHAH